MSLVLHHIKFRIVQFIAHLLEYKRLLSFLQDCLTLLGMQALPALPESLCIIEMGGQESIDGEPRTLGSLYLNIGLQVSE